MNKKYETIQERVDRQLQSDPITQRDAAVYFAKWGEYPPGFRRRRRTHNEWKSGHDFNPGVKAATPAIAVVKPDRLMTAINEFYTGTALWHYELGAWSCTRADDCLAFLLKKSEAECHLELVRRGFAWTWSKP
jgi:hypothetical protein